MAVEMLTGWVALISGLAILGVAVLLRLASATQDNWRQVAGQITHSEVTDAYDFFLPDIRFSYEVDGRDYLGNVVRTGLLAYNWRGPATALCKKYPKGSTIPVFVSASDPASAVLEPGGGSALIAVLFTISGITLIVGVVLLLIARK